MISRRVVLAKIATGIAACSTLFIPAANAQSGARLVKIVDGLDHPWGLIVMSDGSMLVTERAGRLRHVDSSGNISDPIAGLPSTLIAEDQGGLLDVVADADFAANRTLFFTFSEKREVGNCLSVGRAEVSEDFRELSKVNVIFRQNTVLEGGKHFGSRLVFDREGYLFVTTGDRFFLRNKAQDPASHVGKILRITRDGAAAPGQSKNGWAAEIWSIGHRNVQGACLHPESGQLWTAEHGARGGDEINTPQAGRNYGWPVITYGRDYSGTKIGIGVSQNGMEQPLHYWDPSIAPAGMIFCSSDRYSAWRGDLLVCALAGQHVARLRFDSGRVIEEERLFDDVARFRAITEGPDGAIYVITDESFPAGGIYRVEV